MEFAAWDIGGCNIYGGPQCGEYFAKGSQFNLKLYLKNIPVNGVIWVVNVSQDVEYLNLSKKILHDIILSNGQLKDIYLSIVFNKRQNIQKPKA
jgi:hypothetical protein